ncbi:PhzF family phenazine biosynthesis protein [Flavihumibacter stibioxidans]|uniref:Phenazine biosynthesis protein PhzF n=1 Tax=Flavihumibacter stibioxidans TaxID=1834163 RepID=A0ABR7MB25_9BACT|nr:PhzF family phenazine biosynthesis protein [Flavihumibacter stibioxidans]MBC6491709.1 phenazine biosynthesis protein PhzF [Flavihumibacter stibioxidans]
MKTYFVDSFTNQKFKGNPAAVCITDTSLDNETMQSIATEIGFSETAFIRKVVDNSYEIRFFTPKKEIPLCGHATLASSKIIFDLTTLQTINFRNIENVELKIQKAGEKIVMQFPVYETEEIAVPQKVLDALGIEQTLHTRFSPKNRIILIEIADSEKLAGLQPNFVELVQSYEGINGVLVTSQSNDPDFDFHYRYFWPWAGTNEDPVTGAVQTFLTKYWATRLGRNRLNAFQSSLRTGIMTTEYLQDKVLIYGEAVTVFEGEFKN